MYVFPAVKLSLISVIAAPNITYKVVKKTTFMCSQQLNSV